MRAPFARYLVVILLFAAGTSAQASMRLKPPAIGKGKIIALKAPVIGCENKADLRDFPHALPKTMSLSEMPLPYREGHCIRIAPGNVSIMQLQGTYACLHRKRHSCLWVRSEDIGAPMVGDFDTPGREGGRAPAERIQPQFTPMR